jgi:hypothetical protein
MRQQRTASAYASDLWHVCCPSKWSTSGVLKKMFVQEHLICIVDEDTYQCRIYCPTP